MADSTNTHFICENEVYKVGKYSVHQVWTGGLTMYPEQYEIIHDSTYNLIVVEKMYFEHGNGD